jgi:hypothetical protein
LFISQLISDFYYFSLQGQLFSFASVLIAYQTAIRVFGSSFAFQGVCHKAVPLLSHTFIPRIPIPLPIDLSPLLVKQCDSQPFKEFLANPLTLFQPTSTISPFAHSFHSANRFPSTQFGFIFPDLNLPVKDFRTFKPAN